MEGLLTNYYEYHFLYISGIHHVEVEERPGHGPDEALLPSRHRTWPRRWPRRSTTSTARGPSCRRAPCRRSSCGSTPAACRSATSCSRARRGSIGEIQDQALFKVRPMFASLPGVSAPPPFGGSQRTVVVTRRPRPARGPTACRPTRSSRRSTAGNAISPSGNVRIGDKMPDRAGQLDGQATSTSWRPSRSAPARARPSTSATSATVEDAADIADRLRPGQRPARRLHPRHQAGRRLDADASSTNVKDGAARRCRRCCPTTSRSASSSTSRRTSPGDDEPGDRRGCSGPS